MLRSKQKTQQVFSHVCSLFYGSLTSSNFLLVLNHKKAQLLPTIYTTLSCRETPCLYSMRVSVRVCVSKNEHAFFIRHAKAYDNSYMYTHVSKSLFINTHTRALKNLSSLHYNLANVSSLEILGCLSVHFFSRCGSCFCCCF